MLEGPLLGRAAAAAVFALGMMGCQVRTGPYHPAASALPLSRAIPLRFVVLTHCDHCDDCRRSCRQGPSRESLIDSVRAANATFAAASLRFDISSIERAETPDFWLNDAPPEPRTWADMREQAQRLFPWVPDDAWRDPNETKTTTMWHVVLAATYTRPAEITVFVQAGGSHAVTAFPNAGRGMWASDGTFGRYQFDGEGSSTLYLFAHELGHYFGLRHTFAHGGTSPVTGDPWRLADRWDLVYRPGSGPQDPHRFFSSWEEAHGYSDRELRLIEGSGRNGSNCREGGDGALECTLPGKAGYSETRRSGDPALKGLSMPLGPGESRRYRWARNATDYGNMAIPRRLSASQMEMIRIFLTRPFMLQDSAVKGMGRLPEGTVALPSYRHTLGLKQAF